MTRMDEPGLLTRSRRSLPTTFGVQVRETYRLVTV